MLGDQGPDVFYNVQKAVLQTLEDKYHASFLLSAEYQELRKVLASEDAKDVAMVGDLLTERVATGEDALLCADTAPVASRDGEATPYASQMDLSNHSQYARTKLDQLQERLDNKNQALDALRTSLKPESKLLGILGKEVEWLRMEKRQLEAHLTRTEIWGENLGKWQASVQSVEVTYDVVQIDLVFAEWCVTPGTRRKRATAVYDTRSGRRTSSAGSQSHDERLRRL